MREQINEYVIEKEEVVHQLNTLGIQKAAGIDVIHPLILRTLAETDNFVNIVIISVFNKSQLTFCIPIYFKCAIVTGLVQERSPQWCN